jgi:hypothetical protein
VVCLLCLYPRQVPGIEAELTAGLHALASVLGDANCTPLEGCSFALSRMFTNRLHIL